MEENREWDEEQTVFQIEEIVWAKITGFPWWPAKITIKPHPPTNTYRVDFFSQNSHAFLPTSKIAKYDDLRSNIDTNKQGSKSLKRAIAEADKALELQKTKASAFTPLSVPVEVTNLNQKQLLQQPSPVHQDLQEKIQRPQIQAQENQSSEERQQQEESEQSQSVLLALTFSREQREHFVKNLLKKYRLVNLPKYEDITVRKIVNKPTSYRLRKRQVNTKKPNDVKVKRIGKVSHQKQTLSFLLTRRIYQLLKHKPGLNNLNRKQISLKLSRQLLCGQGGAQVVNRLFKWIGISSSQTIVGFYQNWNSLQSERQERQKGSNITTGTQE